LEFELCQRYFQVQNIYNLNGVFWNNGLNSRGSNCSMLSTLKIPMRATPVFESLVNNGIYNTVVYSFTSGNNATSIVAPSLAATNLSVDWVISGLTAPTLPFSGQQGFVTSGTTTIFAVTADQSVAT